MPQSLDECLHLMHLTPRSFNHIRHAPIPWLMMGSRPDSHAPVTWINSLGMGSRRARPQLYHQPTEKRACKHSHSTSQRISGYPTRMMT